MSEPNETFSEDDIAAVAKQIWEEEGRPEGKAEEHWEKARRHLLDEKGAGQRLESNDANCA